MATFTEVSIIPENISHDPFNLKEVWFTNMLLLGFDPVKAEIKHKIIFDKDTFSIPPQKQAMEVILYHLFIQLSPQSAYEEFRDCWPVYDKKQDQAFRKKATNWINSIAKDEPRYGLPRFIAPLLLSPGGDKFYNFLYIFSSYCLQKVVRREAKGLSKSFFIPSSIAEDNGTPLFNDIYEQSTQLHTINQCNHFLSTINDISQLHTHWRNYSQELVQNYQYLIKEKKQLEKHLHKITEGIERENDSCPSLLQMTSHPSCITNNLKRKTAQEKVSFLWKNVDEFLQKTTEERSIIETIVLPSNPNKYTIEGNNFIIDKVPNIVTNDESSLHHNNSIAKTPVNLTELTQVCTQGLKYFYEHIHKGSPLSDLSEEVEFVTSELKSHLSHVTSAQQLKSTLIKHEENLKENIKALESELKDLRYSHRDFGTVSSRLPSLLPKTNHNDIRPLPFIIERNNDMSLLPPSPQIINELTSPTLLTPCRPIVTKTVGSSTPRAVETITRNIQQDAKRRIASKFTSKSGVTFSPLTSTMSVVPLTSITSNVTFSPLTSTTSVAPLTSITSNVTFSPLTSTTTTTTTSEVTSCTNNLTFSPLTSVIKNGSNSVKHSNNTVTPVSTKSIQKEGRGTKRREKRGMRERQKGGVVTCIENKPSSSPSDILAEQIAASVIDINTPIHENLPLEEEKSAFVSKDCIGRTPIGQRVKNSTDQNILDTPSGNWLSKETPPTPFNEVCSESPKDSSSSSPTTPRGPLLLVNKSD